MTSLPELLTTYALIGLERQERLDDWIGTMAFNMDFRAQRIEWDGGPSAQCDLLGSEAADEWLWAWANPSLGFPEDLLGASHALRSLGDDQGIEEFVSARYPVDEWRNGHVLGTVGGALLETDGYFFGHGDNLAVLTLVSNPDLALQPPDAIKLSGVIMRGLGVFPVPHRPAILAYLGQRGAVTDEGADSSLEVAAPAGGHFKLSFDDLDRVASMKLAQGGPDDLPETEPLKRRGFFHRR